MNDNSARLLSVSLIVLSITLLTISGAFARTAELMMSIDLTWLADLVKENVWLFVIVGIIMFYGRDVCVWHRYCIENDRTVRYVPFITRCILESIHNVRAFTSSIDMTEIMNKEEKK